MKQPILLILLLITLISILAFPGAVFADGGGEDGLEFSQTINGITYKLIFTQPIVVGDNPIHFMITDGMGMPITGAVVEVSLVEAEESHAAAEAGGHEEMDTDTHSEPAETSGDAHEMANMPGMEHSAPVPAEEIHSEGSMVATHQQMEMNTLTAAHEDGEYSGIVTFSDTNAQAILVHVTIAGELTEATFPVTVPGTNAGAILLASFSIINLGIIIAAVLMKRRTTSIATL